MKLIEAINEFNDLVPNTLGEKHLINAINELDGLAYDEIFAKAADTLFIFEPYTNLDKDRELLIPAPYSDIYFYYLSAKNDFINREFAAYNNDISMFNTKYEGFAAYYRRNHMPK